MTSKGLRIRAEEVTTALVEELLVTKWGLTSEEMASRSMHNQVLSIDRRLIQAS